MSLYWRKDFNCEFWLPHLEATLKDIMSEVDAATSWTDIECLPCLAAGGRSSGERGRDEKMQSDYWSTKDHNSRQLKFDSL